MIKEDQIQRAVIANLRMRQVKDVVFFHVPNGGARRPAEAAILKSLGVLAGIPDIVIIKNGHCYCLELKTEKGALSHSQSVAIERLARCGATVGIAYGLDEALAWLEKNELIKPNEGFHVSSREY